MLKLPHVPIDGNYLFSPQNEKISGDPSPSTSVTEIGCARSAKRRKCVILNTTKTLSNENSPFSGDHKYRPKFKIRTTQKSSTEGGIFTSSINNMNDVGRSKKAFKLKNRQFTIDSPRGVKRYKKRGRGKSIANRPLKSCLKSTDKRARSLGVFRRLYTKLRFDKKVKVDDGSVKKIKFGDKKDNAKKKK